MKNVVTPNTADKQTSTADDNVKVSPLGDCPLCKEAVNENNLYTGIPDGCQNPNDHIGTSTHTLYKHRVVWHKKCFDKDGCKCCRVYTGPHFKDCVTNNTEDNKTSTGGLGPKERKELHELTTTGQALMKAYKDNIMEGSE